MENNIKRIGEIIEELPKLLLRISSSNSLEMELPLTSETSARVRCLFSYPEASVHTCSMPKNSAGGRHIHDVIEYLIVYSGSIEVSCFRCKDGIESNVDIEEKNVILKSGDFIRIPAKSGHVVKSFDGAEFFVVTIPRAEEFVK